MPPRARRAYKRSPEAAARTQREVDLAKILEVALTAPGSLGSTYSRFYTYSFLNQMMLLEQGVPIEPVATFNRWKELGRQVVKGAKAAAILRPITVKVDEYDDQGNQKSITKFKPVNCIFPVSMTDGEPLPDYEPPTWRRDRALGALGITEVKYEQFDGNAQGYSFDRKLAINPVAVYPLKTTMHEMAHIQADHTKPQNLAAYAQHRGQFEFVAEASAYLVMNELEVPEQKWDPAESRSYIRGWLGRREPTAGSMRSVFTTTDAILKAGRDQIEVVGLSAAS